MYIPFYTKYKANQEDLKHARNRIKELQKRALYLENENYEKGRRINKLENAIAEVRLFTEAQHYRNDEVYKRKILEIIKELDVR